MDGKSPNMKTNNNTKKVAASLLALAVTAGLSNAQTFDFTFDSGSGPILEGHIDADTDNLYITSWSQNQGSLFLTPETSELPLTFSAFAAPLGFPFTSGPTFDVTNDFINEFESGEFVFVSDKFLSEIDYVGGSSSQNLNSVIEFSNTGRWNLRIAALQSGGNGSITGDVTVTPEPSSSLLVALGVLGFAAKRRR